MSKSLNSFNFKSFKLDYLTKLFKVLMVLFFLFYASLACCQTPIITLIKSYKMCRINKTDASEYDCQEKVGQLLYRKIKVIPNKSIATYPKGEVAEEGVIQTTWNFDKISLNNDKDIFIYEFLKSDINIPGNSAITILIRLDYSVQAVIYVANIDGAILKFTLFDN